MKDILKCIYNDIHLKVYGFEYHFTNKKVERDLDIFISKLDPSLDEDFLWNYTIFQFSYYNEMKTRFNRIYLNWIYGDKAIKRWVNKTEAQVYYADQFALKFNISKEIEPVIIKDWSSLERKRFSEDINRQLLHCIDNGLYTKDDLCISCDNFITCKK
jgi:hypothetical protein